MEEEKRSFEKTKECHFFNICEKCNIKYYHNRIFHFSSEKLLCSKCYSDIKKEARKLKIQKINNYKIPIT